MSRSVTHASFTITRHWKASPARVFAAFADEKQKDKWFSGDGAWTKVERSFDFREGGIETLTGKWNSGVVTRFDCVYRDIVPPIANDAGRTSTATPCSWTAGKSRSRRPLSKSALMATA